MNIFALADTPQQAARHHCDQHLHKMILESAQLVSSACHIRGWKVPGIYKPAYLNHPCTVWTSSNNDNIMWVCELAMELAVIRDELNCPTHASSEIIKIIYDFVYAWSGYQSEKSDPRIFCGPAFIKLNRTLTTEQKYRQYYLYKSRLWDKPMTWKGREEYAILPSDGG